MSSLPTPNSDSHETEPASAPGQSPGQPPGQSPEQAPTMPLMSAVGNAEGLSDADLLAADRRSGSVSGNKLLGQSSILIVMIALVAAGSLYAMRFSQGELTDDSQYVARIEQLIVRTSAQWAPVDPLDIPTLDTHQQQVPLAYIKKNPFSLHLARKDPQTSDAQEQPSNKMRLRRLKELQKQISAMRLQSIMGSSGRAVVIIDGEFYREGAQVGSFTIKKINPSAQSVVLTAEGAEFDLFMQ